MKASLDGNGILYVYRSSGWKKQMCPFQQNGLFCGDWCPLFYQTVYDCRPCFGPTYSFDVTAKEVWGGKVNYARQAV